MKNDVAIRKRSQIAKANQTMFIWIAAASAILGIGLVLGIFLFQKLIYNEKVLGEMQNTVSILDHNNSVVGDLEESIRVLDTNSALASAKANESDQAIQVILDALPSEANSFALGASLQNRLLVGTNPAVSLESLQVDPVVGIETLTDESVVVASEEEEGASLNQITFMFVVKGSQDGLKQVLSNLERSIRTIEVTSVKIESIAGAQNMTVRGRAYYEPAKTIELQDKVVKR